MTNERFARLMAGLLAGDRSALREVYEAYAGLVYALALSVTGRREDAEDVTSEVFSVCATRREATGPAALIRLG